MSKKFMNTLRGKKILVIDDAEADRMLISTHLRHLGCRVYQANDGIDGVHKARLISPDAILMDLDMPQCNGYDACKLLLSDVETCRVPVIFLSGYATPEDRVRGLMYGAVDYIAKPFNFDEVKLRLSVHLKCQGAEVAREEERSRQDKKYEKEGAGTGQSGARHYLNEILFRSARVYLLKSLSQAPGLQELARSVGTNAKQLNHSFKECAGVTVYEYLREERMKEAARLLSATSIPVSDIALSVGFSSAGSFSTAFRERFGMSPSRFRKMEKLGVDD